MAVRKFIVVAGQSNATEVADAQTWEDRHTLVALRKAATTVARAAQFAEGIQADDFTMPDTFSGGPQSQFLGDGEAGGTWQTCNLRGKAIGAIRFLTFYNPSASYLNLGTGNTTQFPGRGTIASGSTSNLLSTTVRWQYNPAGTVITRQRTGKQHTIQPARAVASVDTGTEIVTTTVAHKFVTGDPIYESGTAAFGGTSLLTTYYAIVLSGTTLKLATTLANAQAGTAINLTSSGTSVSLHRGYPNPTTIVAIDPPMIPAPDTFEAFTYEIKGGANSSGADHVMLTPQFGGLNSIGSTLDSTPWASTAGYHACDIRRILDSSGNNAAARIVCTSRPVFPGEGIQFAVSQADLTLIASVNTGTETITLSGATPFAVGDPVSFDFSAGSIAGLTAGITYYVIYSSGTDNRVSATVGGSAVDITGAVVGFPVIQRSLPNGLAAATTYYVTRVMDEGETVTATNFNDGNELVTWASGSAHGIHNNEPIKLSGVTLPAELSTSTTYYASQYSGLGFPHRHLQLLDAPGGSVVPFSAGGADGVTVTRQQSYGHFFVSATPGGQEIAVDGDATYVNVQMSVQFRGSLTGLKLRCTSGTNAGESVDLADIDYSTLPYAKVKLGASFGSTPQAGDVYVIEPPNGLTFDKWAYWLPWSPFEGRAFWGAPSYIAMGSSIGSEVFVDIAGAAVGDVLRIFPGSATLPAGIVPGRRYYVSVSSGGAVFLSETYGGPTIIGTDVTGLSACVQLMRQEGKNNPFPPGFNFPNHRIAPQVHQPFDGPEAMGLPAQCFATGLAISIREYLGEDVYVLPVAFNGSSIAQTEVHPGSGGGNGFGWIDPRQMLSWSPNEANQCFQRYLVSLDAAVAAFDAQGDTGECVGIFWAQGEADASYEDMANRYGRNLDALKAAMRQALKDRSLVAGDPDRVPWVHPHIRSTWTYADTVNAAIDDRATADPYMRTVSYELIDEMGLMSDGFHYSGDGMSDLEEYLFAKWIEVQRSGRSEVDICNLALAHIGETIAVTSIDPPDGSTQAALCARFYDLARDMLLEDRSWSFAIRRAPLAALTNTRTEWSYAYRLPADCAGAVAVMLPEATDDSEAQQFVIELDDGGDRIVYTNIEDAVIRYNALVVDTTRFSTKFTMALSWGLASLLAGPIIKGEAGAAESKRCLAMAATFKETAAASDARQRKVSPDRTAPWMTGRN